MGIFDFFKRMKNDKQIPDETAMEVYIPAIRGELIESDKKEVVVNAVTLEDMKQFSQLPFAWNSSIKKVIGPSTNPYAYMDIIDENIDIVVDQLENVNVDLLYVHHLSPLIPMILQIPTWDVLIEPRTQGSYSKIICTPHTFTGKISKYPASLLFMTELHIPDIDTTYGELFYDRNGRVAKAKICFWREHQGYFVHFQTVNDEFIVKKVESTVAPDNRGLPGTIYKAP